MDEYLKHKYSKRVWKVEKDHGPNNPYLSHFPHVRYVRQSTMDRFFTPCSGPIQDSPITVPQEIEWEKRRLFREEPLVVKSPGGTKQKSRKPHREKTEPKEPKGPTVEYTLADLCGELGMSPAKARKLLRSKGKKPPAGGWKWPNKEAAKSIKRFLRKF